MTYLERVIQTHVATATVATISQATERIAEEMAREILKDAQFRADMQALIRQAFRQTIADLDADAPAATTPDLAAQVRELRAALAELQAMVLLREHELNELRKDLDRDERRDQ